MSHFDPNRYIQSHIRTIKDWPEPGVQFRDITPLLQNPKIFRLLVDTFVHRYIDKNIDYIVGIDARGFILGSVVAYELNAGFIPVRKKGKLPFTTIRQEYTLEYGHATCVEMHTDACQAGDRVLLMDDLIATGGTIMAAAQLLQRLQAQIVEVAAIIDLPQLGGSARIIEYGLPIYTLCHFNNE